MKAVICEQPLKLALVERSRPERAQGQVLVRIRRVGLCGTDFHIYAGNQPFLNYPRIMGHELSGEVAEADEASGFAVGQIVTINPYLACGSCIACRKAKPNCCVNIKVMGVHIDGGMTEFVCVPEEAIVDAAGLSLDQAAMVEFLSIGAHAVRRAGLEPGERVLIAGAGPIGIAAALFARIAGADVTLIDTVQKRLAYATEKLGFRDVAVVDENLAALLSERTAGEGFDAVFDATGAVRAIEAGFQYVAHGGRYVLISVVKDAISFADPEFHKREMQLIGSRNATHQDFQYVIGNIRAGTIPTTALHTHTFDLEDMPTAVPYYIENQGAVLKAIGQI